MLEGYDVTVLRTFRQRGTVMTVHSSHHSDFEAGQLALLGVAAIGVAAIVLLVFTWSFAY